MEVKHAGTSAAIASGCSLATRGADFATLTIQTLDFGGRTYELAVRADGERSVITVTEAGNKSAPSHQLVREADGKLAWKTPVSEELREAIQEWAEKYFGMSPVG